MIKLQLELGIIWLHLLEGEEMHLLASQNFCCRTPAPPPSPPAAPPPPPPPPPAAETSQVSTRKLLVTSTRPADRQLGSP